MNKLLTPTGETRDYTPKNEDLLREYEIRIQFLSRGCVVHVGCRSIAFESVENAMRELNEYINNTLEVRKKWNLILNY
jgi:hypothetical protein